MANELSRLQPVPGSTRPRKRIGRGQGSGNGTTCGKGQKGQKSRSGGNVKPGFEGGQMPLARRLPKRGFHNRFAKDYVTVNLGQIQGRFDAGAEIDAGVLKETGVIARIGRDGVKVLGGGEFDTQLTIRAAKFSASAVQRIEAAGGKAEVV